MGTEKDDFEISPEASQANKDLYPINEPSELIRPEIAKKNKWLYPDEFGKMEHGVVGDDESTEEHKKKKKVIFLDADIV